MKLDLDQGLSQVLVDKLALEINRLSEENKVGAKHRYAVAALTEELCTNLMEHSDAAWMEVGLEVAGGHTLLTVRDNGSPFDPTAASVGSNRPGKTSATPPRNAPPNGASA